MHNKIASSIFILIIGLASVVVAQNGPGGERGNQGCAQALVDHLEVLPVFELDPAEIAAITFLREEEKLARDVYLVLSLSYELPIFSQIARSEQRHMDLVATLIQRHDLSDPITNDTIGVFSDPELATLFAQLTERGEQSLEAALTVGATIEDLDLADLAAILAWTDQLDVQLIAENLAAGSRNHLRAFVKALEREGGSYESQYLDAATLEDIVGSDFERAVIYDEFGEILVQCGGSGGPGDNTGGSGGNGGNSGGNGGSFGGNGGSGDGSGDCDGSGPNGT